MDEELKILIREAAEVLDENGRTSFENSNRIEKLLAFIIEKLHFPRRRYGISGKRFEHEMRNIIGQIDPEEDIESKFQESINELKRKLGTSEEEKYSVIFPLPIKTSSINKYKFEFHGATIKQIEDERGIDLLETAQKDISFGSGFQDSPYEVSTESTFWKINIPSNDPYFAIERAEFILNTFLAELNYLHHKETVINYENTSSGPWPKSWSDIIFPFCILVFRNEEFVVAEFSEDSRPRNPVIIDQWVLDEIDNLPRFCDEDYEIDEQLISGLHFFFDGITNPDRISSFLDFWRGLETLTLSEPGDSSSDITNRAATVIRPDDEEFFRKHIDRIVDIRNGLVHGNTDIDVSQADLNLLKNLHESLISHYVYKRGEWSKSDIKFVLHKCEVGKEERIQQQKEARMLNREKIEREIDILDELVEDGD
ncbi:HEPN domain-containing protein [Natronococcus jeotgali]|uniref:HEPN domain-containing protein n=1 Tax=Natronococcus jeotgali TaxID=413812 RepID=UPI0012685A38|nr:HEPN domain-containing protein [Natronococcus jeotgali]